MSLGGILLLNLAVVLVLTTVLWAVSVMIADTSIVDIFWGAGFVAIAWVTFAVSDAGADRRPLLAVLTTVWGVRLAVHPAGATSATARTRGTGRCARVTASVGRGARSGRSSGPKGS